MNIVEAREVIEEWSKKNGFRWQPEKEEALAKLLKQQVNKAEKLWTILYGHNQDR